jgi:hypothetical protein
MRSTLARLTIWLASRLGLVLMPADRIHGGSDAVERGKRWEAFYREAGGLADIIAGLRKEYFEAASAVGHRDNDKLYEFAVADRMARELDREIMQIIVTGKAEFERRQHAEREKAARILRAI